MKKLVLLACCLYWIAGCSVAENGKIFVKQKASAVAEDGEGDGGVEDPLFWYLRCNTTSWNLDPMSQLVDTDDPTIKTLQFDVIYDWMVTGEIQCSVVRTEAEGAWYPGLTFFTSNPERVVVDGGGTLVDTTPVAKQFIVDLPALGTYEFVLDTTDNTFTIKEVDDGGPTCSDGIQNGDETDVDCGGPDCAGCADGGTCILASDCESNFCEDGVCKAQVNECTEEIAVDLGDTGKFVTVPSNGCVKVTQYPIWWGTDRTMNFMNPGGTPSSDDYPLPFTWENTCGDSTGNEAFEKDWESIFIPNISDECATLINLLGNGSRNVTLTYYGL